MEEMTNPLKRDINVSDKYIDYSDVSNEELLKRFLEVYKSDKQLAKLSDTQYLNLIIVCNTLNMFEPILTVRFSETIEEIRRNVLIALLTIQIDPASIINSYQEDKAKEIREELVTKVQNILKNDCCYYCMQSTPASDLFVRAYKLIPTLDTRTFTGLLDIVKKYAYKFEVTNNQQTGTIYYAYFNNKINGCLIGKDQNEFNALFDLLVEIYIDYEYIDYSTKCKLIEDVQRFLTK